jgi:hypothetical protein
MIGSPRWFLVGFLMLALIAAWTHYSAASNYFLSPPSGSSDSLFSFVTLAVVVFFLARSKKEILRTPFGYVFWVGVAAWFAMLFGPAQFGGRTGFRFEFWQVVLGWAIFVVALLAYLKGRAARPSEAERPEPGGPVR